DRIKSLIDHLGQTGEEPEGSDAELIGRLNQLAGTGKTEDAAPATPSLTEGAAGDNPFPYFCGEDDPDIKEALEQMIAQQASAQTAHDTAKQPASTAQEA